MDMFFVSVYSDEDSSLFAICDGSCHCDCDGGNECNWGN